MIELSSALHANESIVPLIYEAAVFSEQWPEAMKATVDFSQSHVGMLSVSYRASRRGEIVAQVGLAEDVVERWEAKHGYNEWVELAASLPPGEVIHAAETVSVEQLLDTPMGREIIAPLGVSDGAGLRMSDSAFFVAALSVYARESYVPASLDRLRFLAPHLARSLALHQRIESLAARSAAFETGLEALPAGIVLLDREAGCLHANAMARGVFEDADGITLREGRVRIADDEGRNAFEDGIEQALMAAPEGAARGYFRIRRRSGRRAYHAVVSPAVTALVDAGSVPGVLLWLTDPDSGATPNEQSIATLLDLTPTESRLATAIASGLTLREYAERAGVTVGTARWTLKQVFAKAEVSSQAELVRLILGSVPSPPF